MAAADRREVHSSGKIAVWKADLDQTRPAVPPINYGDDVSGQCNKMVHQLPT
jgi:hypothetical protein